MADKYIGAIHGEGGVIYYTYQTPSGHTYQSTTPPTLINMGMAPTPIQESTPTPTTPAQPTDNVVRQETIPFESFGGKIIVPEIYKEYFPSGTADIGGQTRQIQFEPYITSPSGSFIGQQTQQTLAGSVIPQGYYQTEQGLIAPSSQTFKTSTGQEFTATPTGSSAQGYIWQTPYGEVRSSPENLQKEITRLIDVQRITAEGSRNLELSYYPGSVQEFGKIHPELTVGEIGMLHDKTLDPTFQTAFWSSKGLGESAGSLFGATVIDPLLGATDVQKNIQKQVMRYGVEQLDIQWKMGLGARGQVFWEQGTPLITEAVLTATTLGVPSIIGGFSGFAGNIAGKTLQLGAGTFATVYGYEILSDKNIRDLAIQGSDLASAQATSVLGQAGLFGAMGSIGMISGIKGISGLGYENVKITTPEGEQSLWKGIYANPLGKTEPSVDMTTGEIKIGNVYALFGKTPEGFVIGSPKLNILGIAPGFVPESPIATKLIMENLPETFSLNQRLIAGLQLETAGLTEWQRSAFIQEKFSKELRTLSPEGFEKVLEISKGLGKDLGMIYGSKTAEAQLPEGALGRTPADVDIQLNIGQEKSELITQKYFEALSSTGKDILRISPESPLLIESFKEGQWHHALDIHSIDQPLTEGLPTQGAFGFKFDNKGLIKIENIPSMTLSESGLRKTGASLIFQEEGFGTEIGREKHISDSLVIKEYLFKSMDNIFKMQTGLEKIETLRGLYSETGVTIGSGSVPIYSPSTSLDIGSPSFIPSISILSMGSVDKSLSSSASASISRSISGSISQSISPSISSFISPSLSPSISPSLIPSISPSISPSLSPSFSPSISPSLSPSLSPSPSPGFPSIPKIIIPPISFDLDLGMEEKPRRKGKSRSRSFFYTPSFISLSLGIYGKKPKFLTGLEIRPLLKGMRGL